MKTLVMFSGQGSQYVGMGLDLIEKYSHLKVYIDQATTILKRDMMAVFGNPNSVLNTLDTQLMMVIVHKMYASYLVEKKIPIDGVLGFSLGEMSSWHASNALNYEALLQLTQARAIAMQRACEKSDGMMAAVLKLDASLVETTCQDLYHHDDYMLPVNYNSPVQTVISGHKKALERYSTTLTELGAKLIPLQVAGAFHTPLMSTDLVIFKEAIEKANIQKPSMPMYLNTTGKVYEHTIDIPTYLVNQVVSPVKFTHMILEANKQGYTQFIEIGPGNVLSGLVKKILPESVIITLSKPDQLEAI